MGFQTSKRIAFFDCDPAGIIFYANVFGLAHRAFEEMLAAAGIPYAAWFESPVFAAPIVNAKAEYSALIRANDEILIEVAPIRIGTSSVLFEYSFCRGDTVCATAQTIHVFMDKATGAKIPIPTALRKLLSAVT